MISPNILKMLQSTHNDPSYSVMITGYDQVQDCNKDRTTLIVEQASPNLYEIIENKEKIIEQLKNTLKSHNIPIPAHNEIFVNNIVKRNFSIESSLDFDVNTSMFTSKLIGDLTNETTENPRKTSLCLQILNNFSIKITDPDNPVLFNRTKFKIRDHYFFVTIPDKIETISITIDEYRQNQATLPNPCLTASNSSIVTRRTYTENNKQDGYIKIPINTGKYNIRISYTLRNSLTNQYMESVTTQLGKSININFTNAYKTLPAIILTIDKEKQNFSSYNLSFHYDDNNNYVGVTIIFKNYKTSKLNRDINVLIIGEEIDRTSSGNASNP